VGSFTRVPLVASCPFITGNNYSLFHYMPGSTGLLSSCYSPVLGSIFYSAVLANYTTQVGKIFNTINVLEYGVDCGARYRDSHRQYCLQPGTGAKIRNQIIINILSAEIFNDWMILPKIYELSREPNPLDGTSHRESDSKGPLKAKNIVCITVSTKISTLFNMARVA
jgi:hypothetical protein